MVQRRALFQTLSAIVLAACALLSHAAEEETLLLTIEGDLIGVIEPTASATVDRESALLITEQYYEQLPAAAFAEVETLHRQILRLIPDFEVAYAAADSAEITHVMSEIDDRLAALQRIYSNHYTLEAALHLRQAYRTILPAFGDQ